MTQRGTKLLPFTVHVAETSHFEFEVWAISEEDAREKAQDRWRAAPTTGQWELPDTETDYSVSALTLGEPVEPEPERKWRPPDFLDQVG
jgi:hypothetical protein